jgi:hypothetical protein
MGSTVRGETIGAGAPYVSAHGAGLKPAALALAFLTLTLLSFFRFPGHTILQSDTQIYIPILEHIEDPSALTRDIMATRPHVLFTLYDEAVLTLHAITGMDFETALMTQQFVYRFIGVAGLYFLAAALGLSPWKSLLAAAVVSLGATIAGPAVLTVAYEPVPRGFALPFLIASMAAVGYGRWILAAACATLAFGFHPPTAVAYCGLLFLLLLRNRNFTGIAALAAAPLILVLTMAVANPVSEPQAMFGRIDPALEDLQRMRASYNWVSIWLSNWLYHYLVAWAAGMSALWRIRERISKPLMLMFVGLPLIGVLAVPLSYVLLEKARFVVLPQFQPGRYLLFVTFVAALLCTVAGIIAAERRRWLEALVLLTIAFAIPIDAKITNVLTPDVNSSLAMKRLGLALALASFVTAVAARKHSRAAIAGTVAAAILPFIVIPAIGEVRNYAPLHHRELDDLADWARQNTAKDALFQFADFNRELAPGVFRARAVRALYADWKAGGQVNFHKQFSDLWWKRWQAVEKPQSLDTYRALGIDYVVFKAGRDSSGTAPQAAAPVYSNSRYVVYKLK